MNNVVVKRALLSVSDKSHLLSLAQALHQHQVEIISTGGTAAMLRAAGIPVTEVSQVTKFPELMGGRLKTLHPMVHGAILGRIGTDDAVMAEQGMQPIDLVVVNFYPFEQTVLQTPHSFEQCIEAVDIGGPTMVRAAAKNFERVVVLTDPNDYESFIKTLETGSVRAQRQAWAAKAFALTSRYDAAIQSFLAQSPESSSALPATLQLSLSAIQPLRYGENPHQQAQLYVPTEGPRTGFAATVQRQGKPCSFNNWTDAHAAFRAALEFTKPACAIIKHANPCGLATGKTLREAYERAYATDPQSAFGGVIAFNQRLDETTARHIVSQQFVEVIVCPSIDAQAEMHFATKPNIRVLCIEPPLPESLDIKSLSGAYLIQTPDLLCSYEYRVVTKRQPTPEQWEDLQFAFTVVKHVKSNGIVIAADGQTLGLGVGQTSRVGSLDIALRQAQKPALPPRAVLASDGFFPFADSIELAGQAGISAIIQPGGSIRDAAVIEAADHWNIAMVFTDVRHFSH